MASQRANRDNRSLTNQIQSTIATDLRLRLQVSGEKWIAAILPKYPLSKSLICQWATQFRWLHRRHIWRSFLKLKRRLNMKTLAKFKRKRALRLKMKKISKIWPRIQLVLSCSNQKRRKRTDYKTVIQFNLVKTSILKNPGPSFLSQDLKNRSWKKIKKIWTKWLKSMTEAWL